MNIPVVKDPIYWATHPLEPAALRTLRHVADGRPRTDRFETAWLISQGLVLFDGTSLTLTEKGTDALAYYQEEA